MGDNPSLTAWIHDEKTIAELVREYLILVVDLKSKEKNPITRFVEALRNAGYCTAISHVTRIRQFFAGEVVMGSLNSSDVKRLLDVIPGILAILNEGSIACDGGDLLTFKEQFGIEWQALHGEGV